MAKSLLLVTADHNFGQVLLYGLEQAGYSAYIAKGKGEAVVRADEKNCELAFLDLDLGAKPVQEIGKALRALKPEIRLVVFCRDQDPPVMEEIRRWRSRDRGSATDVSTCCSRARDAAHAWT